MSVNVRLLAHVVRWVEHQDKLANKTWMQGAWWRQDVADAKADRDDPFCGSAMCVAGKVCLDAGYLPVVITASDLPDVQWADQVSDPITGRKADFDVVAAELLGINDDQARLLFNGDNDANDIRSLAEEIAGQAL